MRTFFKAAVTTLGLLGWLHVAALAATYYIHPGLGNDASAGTEPTQPLQTLARAGQLKLQPGDRLLLAAGQTFAGSLNLRGVRGTAKAPIQIASYTDQSAAAVPDPRATIDAKGQANGILLADCSHVQVSDLIITADAGGLAPGEPKKTDMRCGVLVTVTKSAVCENIALAHLWVRDVFFEEKGFTRDAKEVRSANGTQRYGWGIRFINKSSQGRLDGIVVRNCTIENVSHTGLKFTAPKDGIMNVRVTENTIRTTGGPGVQLSGVSRAVFRGNTVDRSGSDDDSRKWGRGSGLWTWGCNNIVIEKNAFTNANGPGDSAGCHIDFNCRHVVVQYNLSARNAGGFCEILGNNYNCAYRYNISVDDGGRTKGKKGAFQEGKIFWLSGYVGEARNPQGPFNSYIYNNTIYTSEPMVARVAVAASSSGVLVANNIFYIAGASKYVGGDQNRAEQATSDSIDAVIFQNNLFLRKENWPARSPLQDSAPIYGDPQFKNGGGINLKDYIPANQSLIQDKGIVIPKLPGDDIGLAIGLAVTHDILGQPVRGLPDLGAIEIPQQ